MPATEQLWDLYEEWRKLTVTETGAITRSNWTEVRRCQIAKLRLQPMIARMTGSLATDFSIEERNEFEEQTRNGWTKMLATLDKELFTRRIGVLS